MRFLYAKLTGYIGIYNGLGLESIEIDFSKAKNKICVISGPNGVGKSTINNALSILPDGNENFVPNRNASKYLKLTDGMNLYEILFTHLLDRNGNRTVSKASILKNGIELNSNGNIGSYKDIIMEEFNLDLNYLTLSKISGDNRGLADKRPAERKKILSSLISSLETYNSIYKNLNKKSNYYKSYINSLSSKMKNIGDEKNLRSTLDSIISRMQVMQMTIEQTKSQIIESKTKVALIDPDGTMQNDYNNLKNNIESLENKSNANYITLSNYKSTLSLDYNSLEYNQLDNAIELLRSDIEQYKQQEIKLVTEQTSLMSIISDTATELERIKVKLDKISCNDNNNLYSEIKSYKEQIKNIEKELSVIGINDIDNISKEEISTTITILTKIISDIDSLYNLMDEEEYQGNLNDNLNNMIAENNDTIMNMETLLKSYQDKLFELIQNKSVISELSKRPSKCIIDTCPFIEKSKILFDEYGSIKKVEEDIESINKNIESTEKTIEISRQTINKLNKWKDIQSRFHMITEYIQSNYAILNKFRISLDLLDENRFESLLSKRYSFNNIRNLDNYTDTSNDIIQYKQIKEILNNLENEFKIQKNNNIIKEEYSKEYDDKQDQLNKAKTDYSKNIKDLKFIRDLLDKKEDDFNSLKRYEELYDEWNNSQIIYNEAKEKIDSITKTFNDSLEIITKISDMESLLKDSVEKLKPLEQQKKIVDSQITMLESFQKEYNEYKEKFIYIDKLKMYSSPTSDSIQAVFMSIYMDETLDMVNQLLAMIFNGQYKIMEYVINENEFRIPFIGNGLIVDDISSGSTSQVCIMGMIINLVLNNLGSSKFAIVSLDEIDGGLDQNNRYMFVDVLQKISDILAIDQLFIISHSVESALNSVDVILLSNSEEYTDLFQNANIIYQFNK